MRTYGRQYQKLSHIEDETRDKLARGPSKVIQTAQHSAILSQWRCWSKPETDIYKQQQQGIKVEACYTLVINQFVRTVLRKEQPGWEQKSGIRSFIQNTQNAVT